MRGVRDSAIVAGSQSAARQHDGRQDRQTAELRRRAFREAAVRRVRDRAHPAREPSRERRQQRGDRRRDEKGKDGIPVTHLAA